MSVVRFSCPQCHAPLRLQNRALFVGRTFDCPDCGSQLLIEADGSHAVKARVSESHSSRKTNAALQPARPRETAVIAKGRLSVEFAPRPTAWGMLARQPVVLGWGSAAVFALILLFAVRPGHERTVPPTGASAREAESSEKAPNNATGASSQPATDTVSAVPTTTEPNVDVVPLLEQRPAMAPQESLVANDVAAQNVNANEKTLRNPPAVAELPPPPAPEEPDAPLPADKKPADVIAARLQQKIVRFEQAKPVPFVKLLDTLEDLVGVPIVWDLDTVDDTQLQKPVQLKLEMTTVGEIVDAVLQQVSLKRHTIDGKIELRLNVAESE